MKDGGARLALFADVHANREALEACLGHAERRGYDRAVFLGDQVGYCADPVAVLDRVMDMAGRGALVLRGNHDEAVVRGMLAGMSPDAERVAVWTRGLLDRARLDFLERLPAQVEEDGALFVHANAWAPLRWEYILSPEAARRSLAATQRHCTFFGHVHEPALYHLGPSGNVGTFVPAPGVAIPLTPRWRWLANPGSVGQPRDGIPAACYAIYDGRHRLLEYHRVPFDVEAAARKIREAGLPPRFGARLERGQ